MTARQTNWAGNIVYRAARVARPRSVSEARELVGENGQVRAVAGPGHSFNRIADTPGVLDLAGGPAPGRRRRPGRVGHRGGRGPLRRAQRAAERRRLRPAQHGLAAARHFGSREGGGHRDARFGDAQGNLATVVSGLEARSPPTRRPRGATCGAAPGARSSRGCVVGLGSLGLVTASDPGPSVPAFMVTSTIVRRPARGHAAQPISVRSSAARTASGVFHELAG